MSEKEQNFQNTWVDPDDAPELTEDFFNNAKPSINGVAVSKEEFKKAYNARRGRPTSPAPKIPVTIRLSPEVVNRFRAMGEGWQTRIDAILKDWVKEHQHP